MQVSYLEIYNEVINDLLAPESVNLKIREDQARGVYVDNLKEEVVVSPEQVMSLIAGGEGMDGVVFSLCTSDILLSYTYAAYRHVGATDYNEVSSRSHTLFRMVRS